jgi:AcrR family transcriptional regulator
MARATRKTAGLSVVRPAAASKPRPRVDHAARRADYLRAAAKVFLAQGAGASMISVADAAGAAKPVFYRVFDSRSELIEAFFQHIHDTILETQKGEWDGYGWALKVLYLEAKKDPEIFLVALKTFRGDPEFEPWREKLMALVAKQALNFFNPDDGAPAGGRSRGQRASRTLTCMFFDTLVSWLENRDGLTDEQRFKWWGRIIREWRKATREAFQLDAPGKPDR